MVPDKSGKILIPGVYLETVIQSYKGSRLFDPFFASELQNLIRSENWKIKESKDMSVNLPYLR